MGAINSALIAKTSALLKYTTYLHNFVDQAYVFIQRPWILHINCCQATVAIPANGRVAGSQKTVFMLIEERMSLDGEDVKTLAVLIAVRCKYLS